jgi:hypothetical protein
MSASNHAPTSAHALNFLFQETDKTYSLRINNQTPIALGTLPETDNALYRAGFDRSRRAAEADVQIEIRFLFRGQENIDRRAGNTLAGAIFGAAMGAAVGAIAGDAGTGAAIGATAGGISGLSAPATDFVVEAHLTLAGTNGRFCHQLINFNVTVSDPTNAPIIIDKEIANIFNNTIGL